MKINIYKKIFTNKKWLILISQILSWTTVIWIAYVIFVSLKIQQNLHMNHSTDFIDKNVQVKDKNDWKIDYYTRPNWNDPLLSSVFFTFICINLLQLLLGYFIKKNQIFKNKKQSNKYWCSIIFLNGFLWSTIYLWLIYKDKHHFKKFNIFKKIISKIEFIFILLPLLFLFIMPLRNQKFPYYLDKQYDVSTKKDQENFIQFFSDGLDYKYIYKYMNEKQQKELKDFFIFENFITFSPRTAYSQKNMANGLYWSKNTNNNSISILLDEHNIKKNEVYFQKYYWLNPKDLTTKNSNYFNNYSGLPDVMNKINPKISMTYWKSLKNYNAQKHFFTLEHPENVIYKHLANNFVINKEQKPSKITLFENISHTPISMNKKGHYDFLNLNIKTKNYQGTYENTIQSWVNVINGLKKLKDQNGNAYDNTFIFIYGDHSSHYRNPVINDNDLNNTIDEGRSVVLIKFPHSTNNVSNKIRNIVDYPVYGHQIFNIIYDWFNNKKWWTATNNKQDYYGKLITFLKNSKSFNNIDHRYFIIKIPMFNEGKNLNEYWIAKLEKNGNHYALKLQDKKPVILKIDSIAENNESWFKKLEDGDFQFKNGNIFINGNQVNESSNI